MSRFVQSPLRLLCALAGLLLFSTCRAAAPGDIPAGRGEFSFASAAGPAIRVYSHRPGQLSPDSPIVFVMHGEERNARAYRDAWSRYSHEHGFLLLVPEFPARDFPGEAYQQGNLRDRSGRALAPPSWTFSIIEQLFDQARQLTGNRSASYHLYGHSAGGQFVHRFVLFMPQARYAMAVAANPGFYTFPAPVTAYPYGLAGTPASGGVDPAVFGRNFVLMLGAEDTRRNDRNLRKSPQADAQGLVRLERGMNYFRSAAQAAEKAHAAFRWREVVVPGVGHSNARMAPAAAQALFPSQR